MNVEKLKKSIGLFISLSDEEWQQVFNAFRMETLKKNNYFLTEGQVCKSIAYVNFGMLIYFKSLTNSDEMTTDFAFEGDWVTDNHSRLNSSPSLLNIKAIEDTELLVLTSKNLSALYDNIPKTERLGRILIEQAFIKVTQQNIDLQVLSAKEHYVKLLEQQPEVFQKIPLYHIANYLGINPKSLSRIRNEILTNK
ncbi:Crp/Fnr family transcriptional regulator [Arcticibacter eurypsychrophilus]|uniref:Crp/Fnr family transcriptional regulator n=1 Tax=Arcticibacter eurypsychrophilus TaxID=1434752 RepID=UPI00084D718E|nr:Crp/Fnr family transcriptional regulator [Arcticibacter eurypsychrophilus]